MQTSIDLSDDIIDVLDIIARAEELEELLGNEEGTDQGWKGTDDEWDELALLQVVLSELAGQGGDEKWRGDWYPLTLIRDNYFRKYAQQLAEDIGAINPNASWPNDCIDWERAARELSCDYSSININGLGYLYR